MTRKEKSGIRDLTISQWIRNNLPDSSTGFLVSDIDFFIYNYKSKKCMILEVKTHRAKLKMWQIRMYKMISSWIYKGIDNGWKFLGCNTLRFENTDFSNGRVLYNDKLVTENEVIKILSLEGE